MKTCVSCLGNLPVTEFHKNKVQADGLKTICKRCVAWRSKHAQLTRTQEEKDKINIRRRAWRKSNPSATQARNKKEWLQRVEKRNSERPGQPVVRPSRIRHKISEEEYLKVKSSPCEICGVYDDIVIDHNHECCERYACEKCFRGGLCQSCNKGIANFKDNVHLLMRAMEYLERSDAND